MKKSIKSIIAFMLVVVIAFFAPTTVNATTRVTYSVTYIDYSSVTTNPHPCFMQYKSSGNSLIIDCPDLDAYFTGWNTAADGSGTWYSDGDIYSADEDLVLYPVISGSVIYFSNSPSTTGIEHFQTHKNKNTVVTVTSDKPVCEGYEFIGWYKTNSFNSFSYTATHLAGNTVELDSIQQTIFFVAVWKPVNEASWLTGLYLTALPCTVYTEPSKESDTQGVLPINTPVVCIGDTGNFAEIYYMNHPMYIEKTCLSTVSLWQSNNLVMFTNWANTKLYDAPSDTANELYVVNVNTRLQVIGNNRIWAKALYQGEAVYVKMSDLVNEPTIADGFVIDDTVTSGNIRYANEFLSKYLSAIPDIYYQFFDNGYTLYLTNSPLGRFRHLRGLIAPDSNAIGMYVSSSSKKFIVATANTPTLDESAIHEFGHYVFRELLTDNERKEVYTIYKNYMEMDSSLYKYNDHHRENESEFFAESFQFFIIGLVDNDGDIGLIDNIPADMLGFMAEHIDTVYTN